MSVQILSTWFYNVVNCPVVNCPVYCWVVRVLSLFWVYDLKTLFLSFWELSRVSCRCLLKHNVSDFVQFICYFLFVLVLLVSHLRAVAKLKVMKICAYVFLWEFNSLSLDLRSLTCFGVNFCIWCEVGSQRHYPWVQKHTQAFTFSVILVIFFF